MPAYISTSIFWWTAQPRGIAHCLEDIRLVLGRFQTNQGVAPADGLRRKPLLLPRKAQQKPSLSSTRKRVPTQVEVQLIIDHPITYPTASLILTRLICFWRGTQFRSMAQTKCRLFRWRGDRHASRYWHVYRDCNAFVLGFRTHGRTQTVHGWAAAVLP